MTPIGYVLIVLGTAIEGEIVLLAAGYAVFQGEFSLYPVMGAAFLGAFLGDCFWFEIGRRRGDRILARWPRLKSRCERAAKFLGRFALLAIPLMRFQIGMRTISCLALGMSDLSRSRFRIMTLVAAAIWAMVIAYICYLFMGFMAVLARHG